MNIVYISMVWKSYIYFFFERNPVVLGSRFEIDYVAPSIYMYVL